MRPRAVMLSFLSVVVLFPTTGLAQERGQVGLTMGFPTAAGLIWHTTDRIAIRPAITFAQATLEADTTPPTASTTNRALGLGASLLWYVGSSDRDVRPYISPGITYNRATSGDDDQDPVESLAVSGSFGAQYTPSPRLGLYGEVGIGRTHSERTDHYSTVTVNSSVTTWSIRSAVGVTVYLGR